MRAYLKTRYDNLRREGLCVTCANQPTNGNARCEGCRKIHTKAQQQYRAFGSAK